MTTLLSHNSISPRKLIFILGLLSMLMPFSIDMYLPSFSNIAQQFNVNPGAVQLTLSLYIAGFAVGQLFYGPLADSFGRKPIILYGVMGFAVAAIGCALSQTIEQLIIMRLLQGLAAASSAVVINALMRDMFSREEFSRMMSFVTLIMTLAPLLAPILGGWLLLYFNWHAVFWLLAAIAILAVFLVGYEIPETLAKANRQPFQLRTTCRNFYLLFTQKKVMSYILASAFSYAGLFSFLNSGSFVYIDIYGVEKQHFGYFFALNIVSMVIMTSINSRNVKRYGTDAMLRFGLLVQGGLGALLFIFYLTECPFIMIALAIAGYFGAISMISSNIMATILECYPAMAGTMSSLAGTLRAGTGALVGIILASIKTTTAFPMIFSMFICIMIAILAYCYARYRAVS